jgi:hypothetical protein
MQKLLASKGQKSEEFRNNKQIMICKSFKENTAKEELVLEHVM